MLCTNLRRCSELHLCHRLDRKRLAMIPGGAAPLGFVMKFVVASTLAVTSTLVVTSTFSSIVSSQETGEKQTPVLNDDPLAHVDKQRQPNELIDETSPYLLMHAYNPVQWRAWNEKTLELARQQGKPIFLSIGYSSCHWCHVMERESFMDPEIAKILNEKFVCIKVDREERPDVDSIYMTSLSVYNRLARNGGGTGWPLSMFLTPEGKPFVGGTYFPARDGERGAAVGFLTLIQRVDEVYRTRREQVDEDADFLVRRVQQELDASSVAREFEPGSAQVRSLVAAFKREFDEQWGGFDYSPANDRIPKFPQPSNLFALLDAARNWQDQEAADMLELTLEKMYLGGMYDHVGGGFHRYSVDRYWRIPHFEKMLYDNGQLASLYARAAKHFGREDFGRIARGTCDFILREMAHPEGGFYAALDAESDGVEGKYYVWGREELKQLAGASYEQFAACYIPDEPNFESELFALQLEERIAVQAKSREQESSLLRRELQSVLDDLYQARSARSRPLTDTKILTAWNGLMIRGLADCGRLLDEPRYIQAAEKAARFIDGSLRDDRGRLSRSWRDGKRRLDGYLDDYSFFVDGLLALHEATGNQQWLEQAAQIQEIQNELFWDEKRGGYFFTAGDHQTLLARAKNPADNARPSGNSLAALNLLYLARHVADAETASRYAEQASETLQAFSGIVDGFPRAVPLLIVVASQIGKTQSPSK